MRTKEEKRKREWMYRLISFMVGLITFILCTLFFNEAAFGASSFSDVSQKDWHCKFVTELSGEGIVSGYPDGTFRPQNTVTLGHFLSMAMQTADNTGALEPYTYAEKSGAALAASGGKTHWARPFYDRALAQGVLFSDELPSAALDRPVSREWMAVIGSRLLPEDAKGEGLRSGMEAAGDTVSENYDEVRDSIADIKEMSPHSFEIVTSYRAGLLSGYTDGTFRPEGYLTRAEAAAVIWNLRNVWEENGVGQTEDADPAEEPGRDEDPMVSWEMDPPDFPERTLAFYCVLEERGADSGSAEAGRREPLSEEQLKTRLNGLKSVISEQIRAAEAGGTILPEMAGVSGDSGESKPAQAMATQLFEAFRDFAQRASKEENQNKQGLRKEYVCGYPVLTEAVDGEIHMYVKPKGSETRFWGVTPGQVSEEFF